MCKLIYIIYNGKCRGALKKLMQKLSSKNKIRKSGPEGVVNFCITIVLIVIKKIYKYTKKSEWCRSNTHLQQDFLKEHQYFCRFIYMLCILYGCISV